MYSLSALPLSRHVASSTGRGLVRATRRGLATESVTSPPLPTPKNTRHTFRTILLTTAALTGTFYVTSAFVAFNSQEYHDLFSEKVPLGPAMLEFAEKHHWETLTAKDVLESGKNAILYIQRRVSDQINGTSTSDVKATVTEKIYTTKSTAAGAYKDSKDRLKNVTSSLHTKVKKTEGQIADKSSKTIAIARHQAAQLSDGVEELISKAEAALAGKPFESLPEATTPQSAQSQTAPSPADTVAGRESDSDAPLKDGKYIYTSPLPIGFEPPPGFSRPTQKVLHPPVKNDPAPAPIPLIPLIAPAVSELSASEPVIAQLASTIDNLASYLNSNPTAAEKAIGVLETAKVDLTELATRVEKVKEEERVKLEKTLDEQTRDFTIKLLELEMEAQDKLDSQEEGFRKFFDEEKAKFVHAYRQKLDHELRTQTELINERLKQEVIAQGIEMQRRWIREIKVRVEQERGGRLAKLNELAANLKRLERIALDNSYYLDENLRIHVLWSAIRALNSAVDSTVRKPFREELRVLRHVTAAREDPVILTTLESLETSDVPDIGVEPFVDLASWFTTSVAPRVSSVALVPDQNAGVLSHLVSHFFSLFRFERHGLVEGSDVLSVLARAEYHLNEKDLESATRELNQLRGAAQILLADWLDAARRRLEIMQALQVVQSQATLASLLVV